MKKRNPSPMNLQQERFLKKTEAAVFLYMFQDGEAYAMNSFPHLHKQGILLNVEEMQSFHLHEFSEIMLVAKGYLMHEVNGNHHILTPGSLIFVRPYDLHRLLPINSARVILASLVMTSTAIKELMTYLRAPAVMNRFNTSPEAPYLQLPTEEARHLMLQMEQISNEQAVAPENSTPRARALAAHLFAAYLLRQEKDDTPPCSPPVWLSELREQAETWTSLQDAPKRLREISRCHPSHLCKSFQKYYQETPTDFINRLRLTQAARLLSGHAVKVSAVAAELGFDSLSHFHHLFKRHYGVTPAEYHGAGGGGLYERV